MAGLFRRFDDTSAPSMSGNATGSLINVLKEVLVNGYGTLDPLGWEIAFEDIGNNVCVFRPLSGALRPFVRVDDNISSSTEQYASVIVYESMSDVNTGFFPCPSSQGTYNTLVKAGTNISTNMPWTIIGDNKGFWFLNRPWDTTGNGTGTGLGKLHTNAYIGEWTCNVLSNDYNILTILNRWDTNWNWNINLSEGYTNIMRDPETIESGSIDVIPYVGYSRTNSSFGINNPYSSPRNGQYFYEPVLIHIDSISLASFTLGVIPGLYQMLWQSPTYEGGSSWYRQTEDEMTTFFDGDMYVFPGRNRIGTTTGYINRLSILTGDNFRSAN